ncbi:MAG: hypothetical protein KC619_06600, partial [Myxococcales bacterium]|nr:hypothetical protein [Myxococcales bacterium]
MTIEWVFDELPPSGARRGGDPSEHAFRRDLESFVREVVQNANDQAVAWPRVTFRLAELQGAELDAYLESLRWPTLLPHLEGAARATGGTLLGEALAALRDEKRLLLLDVEDRGTAGLSGDESDGESHFRALCKDTLYSHKAHEAAGGSYGLGKSVLWTFSGLSTVLFNSELIEPGPGQVSPRLIGRAELPSHARADGRWFSGSGWLGRAVALRGRGRRAESVWSSEARALADELRLARVADQPGTTIQIVGFRDPTREDEPPEATLAAIEEAAARFFWPAMVAGRRGLRVAVARGDEDPREVSIEGRTEIAPFLACLRGRAQPSASLDAPGDVVVRRIPLEIPATRDGAAATRGEVDLVVRLAPEGERHHPWVDRVAQFRGPGMVVRYWDRRGLLLGMRPFHAMLVAGLARAA